MEKTYKILIADDEELTRTSLAKIFRDNGFKVIEASDGEKALMFSLTLHPDVVLLDVQMPGLNGMQVIEKIRADEWGKNVVVIFLTSFDTSDQMIDTISKYNPSFYLRKEESTPDVILRRVKDSLKIA